MRIVSKSARRTGVVVDGRERYASDEVPRWVGRLPWSVLEETDRKLAGLGRGAGALRLQGGEVLDALVTQGGHHELGFSSLGAYARERCGRSGRWAAESRLLARRLAKLPTLRAALVEGRLNWAMAEVLARHATAENEGALFDEALGSTVRQMRERLKQSEEAHEEDEEPSEPKATLTVTVEAEDAWTFEATRILVEHIEGRSVGQEELMEALLAEGWVELQGRLPREEAPALGGEDRPSAAVRAWLAELRRMRREGEEECEERNLRGVVWGEGADMFATSARERGDGLLPGELPAEPRALDALLRRLATELDTRDLVLGELALRLFHAHGWRRLGYGTERQYAIERVGVSWSSLKAKMALARKLETLTEVKKALVLGEVGSGAALLLSRVADAESEQAWLRRASERTVKHLSEEVRAAELAARLTQSDAPPPDEETLSVLHGIERRVASGTLFQEALGQMSAAPERAEERFGVTDAEPLPRGRGRVTLKLRLALSLCRAYRELERAYLRSRPGAMPFLRFLCWSLWRGQWRGEAPDVAYSGIYERDRYRCASPTCERRDVTPHHLKFRSHGGGEETENLVSLCVWCHLHGIHEGRLWASPPASDVYWRFGRGNEPVLVVHGRRKVA